MANGMSKKTAAQHNAKAESSQTWIFLARRDIQDIPSDADSPSSRLRVRNMPEWWNWQTHRT